MNKGSPDVTVVGKVRPDLEVSSLIISAPSDFTWKSPLHLLHYRHVQHPFHVWVTHTLKRHNDNITERLIH